MKRKRKPRPSGLRKYWPHLTLKEAAVERQKLSDAQGAKCAICSRHESEFKNKLGVDHNHKTGKVRGLLCYFCNKFVVGRNTIERAEQILAYLNKYDVRINDLVPTSTELDYYEKTQDRSPYLSLQETIRMLRLKLSDNILIIPKGEK